MEGVERLVDEGNCKAIGLSDVSLDQTQEIFEAARIKPAVVHVESHPYLPQWDLLDYCSKNGIVFQAFAALGIAASPTCWKSCRYGYRQASRNPRRSCSPGPSSAGQPS